VATVADVLTALEAKIVADIGSTRLASDLRDDLDTIADGATRHQVIGTPQGYGGGSNTRQQLAAFAVTLKYKLASGTAERTWTEGALLTHLAKLTDSLWWQAVTGVYGFVGDAAKITVEITRDAMLVTARVQVSSLLLNG
jgi:hypothetical protein